MHFPRKLPVHLLLFGLCLFILPAFISPAQAESIKLARVYGRVVDATNSLPLSNANVVFWDGRGMFVTETNTSGFYTMKVTGKKSYYVYAYQKSSSTPGLGYIPAFKNIHIEEEDTYNLSFTLLPGASIKIKGETPFFKTLRLPKAIFFTIVNQAGLRTNVTSYDEDSVIGRLLNLKSRLLFVPSQVPIKVEVDIYYSDKIGYRISIDREDDYLNLTQGDLLTVDLRHYTLPADIGSCYDYLASTQSSVAKAEGVGFYVSYEENELSRAEDLLKASTSALSGEAYDEAYADLREAYLIVKRIEEGLFSLYLNASRSTLFITPFLVFTTMATAALLSEKAHQRFVISLVLYGVLFGLLYLLHPGYATLGVSLTSTLVVISFLAVYCLIHGLPYAFREKTSKEGLHLVSAIIAAFSLSIKNLRRRKLRALLISTLMLISVFAFINLTSFSLEHGFFIQHLGKTGLTEGFFVSKPSTSGVTAFDPIQSETLEWLQGLTDVLLVAPKIESMPQESPLGSLSVSTSPLTFDIWGVIGVSPIPEAKITGINSIVIQGRFLGDDDLDGILISQVAATILKVKVNDTVQIFDRSFILTGIFDEKGFDGLKDLNGELLTPKMINYAIVGGQLQLELVPCPSFSTVIMQWKTAQGLPGMILSRIDVKTQSSERIIPIARQTVLKWAGIEIFASVAAQAYRLFVGSYYIASGFMPAMVPLALVILNIGAMMSSTVYERRQELAVMSSSGLNPFHITALFVAEALTIGVVAGSLGYFLGIINYRFMALLPFPPAVKQKVDAIWGILALCLSIIAAALGSALPARRASTIVTPSLLRKWKIEEKSRGLGEPWVLRMPIRVRRENLEEFFLFMGTRLQTYAKGLSGGVESLRIFREGEFKPVAKSLSFTYVNYDYGVNTENELTSIKSLLPHWYNIKLTSIARRGSPGERELYVWLTANFVRRLILQYSTEHKA